jgi:outer membrane protein assembly factor BamB
MKRSILLAFLAPTILAGAALAGNWERFRGPNGTGTVDDKDVPLTFDAKQDKNVVWKVLVPGVGNSSPIVWGKSVFLQASDAKGKERSLICFDTADGKVRWQRKLPGVFVKIRKDSSLASATATTDGEAVFIPFWDGKDVIMTAFDFQGEKLWSRNLGAFISQHGAGASPILYKDKLILANDMDAYVEQEDKSKTPVPVKHPSLLVALNKKTGEVMWETPREAERACYSAPFLRQRPGHTEPELVVLSTTALAGYDLNKGTMIWCAKDWQGKSAAMPLRTVASPAVAGDTLIACSGDGKGDRLAVALSLPGASKSDAVERLWENIKDFPYVATPLVRGSHFYFVNDKGLAGCYDAASGKRIWYERLEGANFYASPVMIDGKIYAASENGDVFVFAAETKFKLLAQNSLGEGVRASPAVADGRLYIRGERHLFCIGKNK